MAPEIRPLDSEGRRALLSHVTPPITAAELARRIGVSPAAISQWLAGATAPSRDNAAAIETITGIPASAWVEDTVKAREAARASAGGEGVAK